ncbi:flagellar motor protein MotB [Pseudobacteroides cellulosolvens]|uniref:Motility protein B, N-terminal domain containing protein n=1 Tax=Pseudobacteroides cellulosolvens ATCC 35603 = DSM 2933 TaxID=398512 RepID=A0A0L6JL84_9FIRM|nr:flagellar motor protein MotB [Pseudobacteroides cellulosolvens]KNY26142.1 Motility protein B, N-terminal domain containing protein [Pseudobacteroides cellulosolvens ATCC 35603 = DSM 2933]
MAKSNLNEPEEEQSEGAPEWMVTYSDLVTLLLTFFILLFSMATLDKQKFMEVAKSLRSSFTHTSNGEMFDTNKGKDMIAILESNNGYAKESKEGDSTEGEKEKSESATKDAKKELEKSKITMEDVKKELEITIKEEKISDNVKLLETQDKVILRIDSVILFDSGFADIKKSGLSVLGKIGQMLKKLDNDIIVEGHTDSIPIHNSQYPSNWELSAKRSINVVLFLAKQSGLPSQQLTSTASGEFKPILPNNSEANRAKNRRIDIVIIKDKIEQLIP